MNQASDERVRQLLKKSIAPVRNTELNKDLWPSMLRKFDEKPVPVSRLDLALAAVLAACCVLFPGIIPALLYHL